MELLSEIKTMLNEGEKFTRSKNYYFETHICDKAQETVRVKMDYVVHKEENNDDAINFIRFGICPHCKEVFYHKDYADKNFSGKIKF